LKNILNKQEYRQKMLQGYDEIIAISGDGTASKRTAEIIYNEINKK